MVGFIQHGRLCAGSLFFLIPQNEAAMIVTDPLYNGHNHVTLQNEIALEVGRHGFSRSNTILSTIGRDKTSDITIVHNLISKHQCSFEIDPATGVVMLWDRSSGNSTHVSGNNAMGFRSHGPRRVVLLPGVNDIIELGPQRNLKFRIKWIEKTPLDALDYARQLVHSQEPESPTRRRTDGLDEASDGFAEASSTMVADPEFRGCAELPGDSDLMPEFARLRVRDPAPQTTVPSRLPSAPPSLRSEDRGLYWFSLRKLSQGEHGEVHHCVDAHTGSIMVVKRLNKHRTCTVDEWPRLKRQLEFLQKHQNDHMLKTIASHGWDAGPHLDLFFEKQDGNLGSLMENLDPKHPDFLKIGITALEHALCGLKYLHSWNFFHGSISPRNILYTRKLHRYNFVLSDFNTTTQWQRSEADSMFLAPELSHGMAYGRDDGEFDGKVDVWALYVTLLVAMNICDFNSQVQRVKYEMRPRLIAEISQSPRNPWTNMFGMVVLNSSDRWRADQALKRLDSGKSQNDRKFYVGNGAQEGSRPPNTFNNNNNRFEAADPSGQQARQRTTAPPRMGIARQSTIDKAKSVGVSLTRRLTGEMKNGILKATRPEYRGRY